MKQPARITIASLAVALVAGVLAWPAHSSGQAANDEQAIAALLAEITQQQAKIAANQKQTDEKLAVVAESIRVARIFVSRGGGKAK